MNPEAITRDEGPTKGRYRYAGEGGEAELTYSRAGAAMLILDHTEVPSAFRGQGVGAALVARAVADARREGRQLLPLCPFAAAQFRSHPEWRDVLAR